MKTELYKYAVTPGIVKLNEPTTLTLSALEPQHIFDDAAEYRVEIWDLVHQTHGDFKPTDNIFELMPSNGCLRVTYTFLTEAEHFVRVFEKGRNKHFLQVSVYALEDDLYALRPLKGDFHVHSCRSDGKEYPALVAANYREAGFDFMAVTDHRLYEPSVEAQQAYADVNLGLCLLNGEEVHTPDNLVHVIHFGGDSSVNEMYRADEDGYYREVQAIIDRGNIPHEDAFTYAANLWAIEKIRAVNGLAVFCHPHWINDTYNVPDGLSRAFLANRAFDAFELIGGQSAHENNMQTALYYQLRAEGVEIPITGASDSHGTINRPLFDKMYTVVFAEENTRDAILAAVKNCRSVAVEVYEDSVNYSVHGSYRLVSYARFLLEHYFPLTRRMCAEEGILMRAHLDGDATAKTRLNALQDRVDRFYAAYAGR